MMAIFAGDLAVTGLMLVLWPAIAPGLAGNSMTIPAHSECLPGEYAANSCLLVPCFAESRSARQYIAS